MKVAIFGGSFNPIQKGHTRLANHLVKENIVDMVLMMPCYKSLYNKELASGEHRLKMIELADRLPHVQPFDWEIRNKIEGLGPYEIMKMLKSDIDKNTIGLEKGENGKPVLFYREFICRMPERVPGDDELYFVMGLDNSQKIKKWPNGQNIVKEFNFIVVPRIGTNTEDIWFMDPPNIWLGKYEADNISSTTAKQLLASHTSTKEVLDPAVYDYIIEQNLYKGETP